MHCCAVCEIPLGVDGHLYVLYSCTHTDIYWLDLSRRVGCAAAVPCAVDDIRSRACAGLSQKIYISKRTHHTWGYWPAQRRNDPLHIAPSTKAKDYRSISSSKRQSQNRYSALSYTLFLSSFFAHVYTCTHTVGPAKYIYIRWIL